MMKALTIRIPWPWAICYLGKPLENRNWRPSPTQLRPGEKFAIHAGKMPLAMEIREAFAGMAEMGVIDETTKVPTLSQLRTQESSIVAVATYGDAVGFHPSKWFCGLYGWKLLGERDNVPVIVLPEPVKCRGMSMVGFLAPWNVPASSKRSQAAVNVLDRHQRCPILALPRGLEPVGCTRATSRVQRACSRHTPLPRLQPGPHSSGVADQKRKALDAGISEREHFFCIDSAGGRRRVDWSR